MSDLRERIQRELRNEVCSICVQDREGEGCVGLADDTCLLMARLDEIMEVISGVRDYSLEPYRDRIRQVICASCEGAAGGSCDDRQRSACALDAYFPRIVAVIERELFADRGVA